ncbi:diaminohydroxyphosphoribosylaminopyrimidine deaminase [Fluviicoccus keumensis]|uniref:Riboflavin biosynthesis protein RibD n=1 Tax=Fluviicoccus keumensis TaxID=1435465 RepID=A0A4Q7ZCY8_9GAMM|nr:diaminohydroxyphosphoribosylaminopyrimidine deaminase [Fluviicoccus keumensis]
MTDHRWMARALQLAREGLYTTQPNPRVGCVIVRDGEVVGEGFHPRTGQPHAEVFALRQAGERARGATAFVTLEPCAHFGRTPPCAEALIAAGVARVVMAGLDSNPLVGGKGRQMLEAAGIATATGVLEAEAQVLNPGFLRRMAGGIPWVRLKMAGSLDGRTGMPSGESKWITGPDARRDVQKWRAMSSAIITGIGTVLADDPALDIRPEEWTGWHYGEPVQPWRVILDSRLRTPLTAKVLKANTKVIVVASPDADDGRAQALTALGAEVWRLPHGDLPGLLQRLAAQGANEVLVEAGATLAGAFLQAGVVDELVLYLAPTLLGSLGRPLMALPIEHMAGQKRLDIRDVRNIGADIRILARPAAQA